MTTTAVHLTACPNCGAALDGAFCAQCGQKAAALNPSLSQFIHELFHEIAHVDGKILQSVRLLFTRPGFLSREQFEGRRARYVSPIRLYLIFSVVYFGAAAFAPLAGPTIKCVRCPPERTAEIEREMRQTIVHWAPRAMFLLVPFFAGVVALAARPSGRNYPQHLYFAMHVHAVWFAAGAVAGIAGLIPAKYVSSALSQAAGACALLYLALAFRRAYDATWLRTVVGTLAVFLTYIVAVTLTLLAIVLPGIRN
jgi:hypothetical protein